MNDQPRGPRLTVDVIIHVGASEQNVVLVKRKFPPLGWAIPGGFVEWGESAEHAAVREAREETALEVKLRGQFRVYSDPRRDPRGPTASVVFIGDAYGHPRGGDDAAQAKVFRQDDLPQPLVFDHAQILTDYFNYRSETTPVQSRVAPPTRALSYRHVIRLAKMINAPVSNCFRAFLTQRSLRRWYDQRSRLAGFHVGARVRAEEFPGYEILVAEKNHTLIQQYTSIIDGVGIWSFVPHRGGTMLRFDHLALENRGTERHARTFHWQGLLENLAAYCEGRALPFVDAEYKGKLPQGVIASTSVQYAKAMRLRKRPTKIVGRAKG